MQLLIAMHADLSEIRIPNPCNAMQSTLSSIHNSTMTKTLLGAPQKGLCLLFFQSFLPPRPFSLYTGMGGGRINNGKVFCLFAKGGTILSCNCRCPLFFSLSFLLFYPSYGVHIRWECWFTKRNFNTII